MQILERQQDAASIWPVGKPPMVEAQRVCKNWDYWQNNEHNWANPPKPLGNCTEKDRFMCFQDDSGV